MALAPSNAHEGGTVDEEHAMKFLPVTNSGAVSFTTVLAHSDTFTAKSEARTSARAASVALPPPPRTPAPVEKEKVPGAQGGRVLANRRRPKKLATSSR